MHQFAISLIWGIYENGRLGETFRYMEDGSFNTVDEEEYTLPDEASIGLVHPIELTDEALAAWKQQLEDYEITQSIDQLSRPSTGSRQSRPRTPPWRQRPAAGSMTSPWRASSRAWAGTGAACGRRRVLHLLPGRTQLLGSEWNSISPAALWAAKMKRSLSMTLCFTGPER